MSLCWLEFDPFDIGQSLIYLIKYANYVNYNFFKHIKLASTIF